jgi:hypothetical protein
MAWGMQQQMTDEVARIGALSRDPTARDPLRKCLVAFLYQLHFLPEIDSRAAEDAGDLGVIQSRSVVLYADGVLFLVKLDFANAVNLPGVVQGHHLVFAGRGSVFKNHIEQSHEVSSTLPSLQMIMHNGSPSE